MKTKPFPKEIYVTWAIVSGADEPWLLLSQTLEDAIDAAGDGEQVATYRLESFGTARVSKSLESGPDLVKIE